MMNLDDPVKLTIEQEAYMEMYRRTIGQLPREALEKHTLALIEQSMLQRNFIAAHASRGLL